MPNRSERLINTEAVLDISAAWGCTVLFLVHFVSGSNVRWLYAALAVVYVSGKWGIWRYRRSGATRLWHLVPLGLKRAKCSNCHYDLRSSFETCPECGLSVMRSRVPKKAKTELVKTEPGRVGPVGAGK